MKAVVIRIVLMLAGIVLVVPFFAIALIVGRRAVVMAHNAQDDLLLVALAVGGAVASMAEGSAIPLAQRAGLRLAAKDGTRPRGTFMDISGH